MFNSVHYFESDHLCTLLREARVRARVTQQEVSKRLGCSQSFLSDIERGKRRLDTLELRSLCAVVGVDWKNLLFELETRIAACEYEVPQRQCTATAPHETA